MTSKNHLLNMSLPPPPHPNQHPSSVSVSGQYRHSRSRRRLCSADGVAVTPSLGMSNSRALRRGRPNSIKCGLRPSISRRSATGGGKQAATTSAAVIDTSPILAANKENIAVTAASRTASVESELGIGTADEVSTISLVLFLVIVITRAAADVTNTKNWQKGI